MRGLLIVLALLLVADPAAAQGSSGKWILAGQTNDQDVWIEWPTINGDYRRVRFRYEFLKPREVDGREFQALLSVYEFDCMAGRYRPLENRLYETRELRGRGLRGSPKPEWQDVPGHRTATDIALEAACKPNNWFTGAATPAPPINALVADFRPDGWSKYAEGGGSTSFVQKPIDAGLYKKLWTKFEYAQPQQFGATQAQSMAALTEYDCAARTERLWGSVFYAGPALSGDRQMNLRTPDAWKPSAPQLADIACGVKPLPGSN